MSKIEIKTVGEDSPFTAIYVDGHQLTGVRRFELKQEVGNNMPILTVDLNALDLSTDVQVLKINQYGNMEIGVKFKEHSFKNKEKFYDKKAGEIVSSIFHYQCMFDPIDILKDVGNFSEYIEAHFEAGNGFIKFEPCFWGQEIIVKEGDYLIEYSKFIEKTMPKVPIYKVVGEDYIKENIVETEV